MNRLCAYPHALSALLLIAVGCTSTDSGGGEYAHAVIDTLESGEVVVRNSGVPLWGPGEEWQISVLHQIGTETGADTLIFGSIKSFAVDRQGQVHILDGQTQQIHVFGADGLHVRTMGGKGSGPGEFERANKLDLIPDGGYWVAETQRSRIHILSAFGDYVSFLSVHTPGYYTSSYPGGRDWLGRYNAALLAGEGRDYRVALARFGENLVPLDTVEIPRPTIEPEEFVHESEDWGMSVPVPYQSYLVWRFSPSGNFWTLETGLSEFVEVTPDGRVLRRVTMPYEPIPVTREDREGLRANLAWFTSQGGQLDMSKVPNTKPAVSGFFVGGDGSIWVDRVWADEEDENRLYDVLNPDGVYLGEVRLPFRLRGSAVVRSGKFYGVSRSEDGAAILVVARMVQPGQGGTG